MTEHWSPSSTSSVSASKTPKKWQLNVYSLSWLHYSLITECGFNSTLSTAFSFPSAPPTRGCWQSHSRMREKSIVCTRPERWSIFQGNGMAMVVFLQRWNRVGFENSHHHHRWFLAGSTIGSDGFSMVFPILGTNGSRWLLEGSL